MQGDKRLIQNPYERVASADINRLQTLSAAEKAALLRVWYNHLEGDWYSAGGLQTPISSSTPSLKGDVFGGLMVQPDNAGYFLVQGGAAGFLEPAGAGADDSPYRLVVDPGVTTPGALPFTSNAGGGSPRWDVVECQPVDALLSQESRNVLNPVTGVALPQTVDKVRAMRLNYRVRVGTPGSGFPGLAAGWMPLAVVCAPAGSSSLLTSDVWDVRPLVRERVRLTGPVTSGSVVAYCPLHMAEYRFRLAADAGANVWVGAAESSFNGYVAGGKLERSTPSTLAQFGDTGVTGGRAGLVNADLADNRSTYTAAADAPNCLVALFPEFLPRWQRYSQTPVGAGRVPSGPRGILVATSLGPNTNGTIGNIPLPAAMSFGVGAVASGCLLASARWNGATQLVSGAASGAEHYSGSRVMPATTISGITAEFVLAANDLFPGMAPRRILVSFNASVDNAGVTNPSVTGFLMVGTEFLATFFSARVPVPATSPAGLTFQCWVPMLPRTVPTDQNLPGSMKIRFDLPSLSINSANIQVLAWSSSDR